MIDEGTYEAKLYKENGQIRHIQANTIEALKSKCHVALHDENVVSIEIVKVYTVGYLKCPLLSDEELFK